MAYDEAMWIVDHVKQFGVGFTVQHMRQMSAEQIAKDKVALRFLEPTNTMLEGQIMVEVKGVKILMKEGAYPRNRGDGVLVADNTDLGAYETEPLVVSGLQSGKKYCFAAFPYSTIGQYDESGVDANHVEQIVHAGETVTVTVNVDDDAFFTYSTVTLHNVTKGTTEEKTVAAGKSVTFKVDIFEEYYLSAGDVTDYLTPADTEHFTAAADGTRAVEWEYKYLKNSLTVNVTADDDVEFGNAQVTLTLHNVTAESTETLAVTGKGTARFAVENGSTYYVSASDVEGYATPADTEPFSIVRDVEKVVTMEYLYKVETATVTLSADDGSDVTGQSVILHNNTTGAEESKTWEGTALSFKINEGESYYITAAAKASYVTPKSANFTAAKGNKRTVALEYLYDVEVVTVTLATEDAKSVTGQSVILHNNTTGTNTSVKYTGSVSFKVPSGQSYYVTATDNGDYITPKSANYTAVKGNNRAVTLTYEIAKDLNSLTWAQIAAYAESGKAAQMFEIGDTKDFTLTTGEKCKAVILDFNHDPLASNTAKTAGITFGTLNCLAKAYPMNSSDTNAGGYDGSKMFTTINTVFYDKLPADMKPHIKKVRKKASAGSQSSTIKSFDVFAFLLSEIEVFNTTNRSFPGEGTFYPYFATAANRIKKLGESGSACYWWLRSPRSTYSTSFCYVYSDGALYSYLASNARGLSAGFCV